MIGGLGNMGQILKIQKEIKNIQKRLSKNEEEGRSPDGSVRARVNGEYRLTAVELNEAAFSAGDRHGLERMIIAAVNEAVGKTKEAAAQEMSRLTGGLNIPGLGDLFK
jgi:nucleoid-associated protein EbfC